MRRLSSGWIGAILIMAGLAACESDYTRLVKKELKSGVVNDSIFLTFRFGETRKEFYTRGWKVNSEGKIRQGPGNNTVEYMMKPADSTKSPIRMLFYPKFTEEDQLHVMDISFDYSGWSPWLSQYNADKLLPAVRDTLMSWYGGNEFMKIEFETEPKEIWVKVDGIRKISLHVKDLQVVEARIEDLRIKYKEQL